MIGPGRYDDYAQRILDDTKARLVLVLVVEGSRGSGMSMKATVTDTLMLPVILRRLARDIEQEHVEGRL